MDHEDGATLPDLRRDRLRVGVVGLGRLWEARHKPALAKLRDLFSVVAVYDQVAGRAAIEAHALRCSACDGLAQLVDRDDVDAVYVLTPQWFGTHPIRLAAEAGKPVYSALPATGDPEALERLAPLLRDSGIPFMPELARRFYPATLRLRELIATTLGPVRCVLGHTRVSGFDRYVAPGPSTQLAPVPLAIDPGGYLLDWCRFVFGREPNRVRAVGATIAPVPDEGSPDHLDIALDFDAGGFAQVTIERIAHQPYLHLMRHVPQPGFRVFAERGAAWVEMPDRIAWSDDRGVHEERLPADPTVGETLNEQFFRLVRGEPSLAPGLDDLLAIVRLDREVRASLQAVKA